MNIWWVWEMQEKENRSVIIIIFLSLPLVIDIRLDKKKMGYKISVTEECYLSHHMALWRRLEHTASPEKENIMHWSQKGGGQCRMEVDIDKREWGGRGEEGRGGEGAARLPPLRIQIFSFFVVWMQQKVPKITTIHFLSHHNKGDEKERSEVRRGIHGSTWNRI